MIRLSVNLAHRPAENLRRAWVLWGGGLAVLSAILLILATAALAGWWDTRHVQEQIAVLERRTSPLRQQEIRLDQRIDTPQGLRIVHRAQRLNQLLDRKQLSWTVLFQRLQHLLPAEAALVSLETKTGHKDGRNTLEMLVSSTNLAPALQFVQNLEQAPDFAAVQVNQEGFHPPTSAHPSTQYRLSVTAEYLPDAGPASATPQSGKIPDQSPNQSRPAAGRQAASNEAPRSRRAQPPFSGRPPVGRAAVGHRFSARNARVAPGASKSPSREALR